MMRRMVVRLAELIARWARFEMDGVEG